MKKFHLTRAQGILDNQIVESLKNNDGILFHSIPSKLLAKKPIDWNIRDQSNCPKIAFRKFSDSQIQYKSIEYGFIGNTDEEYTIWFDDGIIETFSSPIIHQTEIPNAPIVDYIQVDMIIKHTRDFINAVYQTYEKCYKYFEPFTLFISLVNVQGVFYNARERNYTTTLPCRENLFTIAIVIFSGQGKVEFWHEVLNEIHSSIMQLNPVR